MSASIIPLESHRDFLKVSKARTRKRVFDLGRHTVATAPGLSWQTNYWIKKIEKGRRWELYASDEESLRTRQYCGTYTPSDLRKELELADFLLDEEEWRWMGLGERAEVLNLNNFERKREDSTREVISKAVTFSSGAVYVGEWQNGSLNGRGTHTLPNKESYTGEWKDGKKHGRGTNTWSNGDSYTGGWYEGQQHGHGTYNAAKGFSYDGEWLEGMPHGKGTYTGKGTKKDVWDCEWREGKQHGFGSCAYACGRKYVGNWENGKEHGYGTITDTDGTVYSGGWKDGKRHGQGTITYFSGRSYSGKWENGAWKG